MFHSSLWTGRGMRRYKQNRDRSQGRRMGREAGCALYVTERFFTDSGNPLGRARCTSGGLCVWALSGLLLSHVLFLTQHHL